MFFLKIVLRILGSVFYINWVPLCLFPGKTILTIFFYPSNIENIN